MNKKSPLLKSIIVGAALSAALQGSRRRTTIHLIRPRRNGASATQAASRYSNCKRTRRGNGACGRNSKRPRRTRVARHRQVARRTPERIDAATAAGTVVVGAGVAVAFAAAQHPARFRDAGTVVACRPSARAFRTSDASAVVGSACVAGTRALGIYARRQLIDDRCDRQPGALTQVRVRVTRPALLSITKLSDELIVTPGRR